MSTRIGPKMTEAAEYVAAHPGCTQQQASIAVGPNHSHGFGSRVVRRAQKAGLLRYEGDIRGYRLYVTAEGREAIGCGTC